MATIIKPKRSGTASSVPTTANLADGEMAVNTADKIIYVRDGANVVPVAALQEVVAPTITPGDTTHAPSGDAVNTALGTKFDKSGGTITGSLAATGDLGSGGSAFLGPPGLYDGTAGGLWAQRSGGAARFTCASAASNVQFIGARCAGTLESPTATPSSVALLEFDAAVYDGAAWQYPGVAAFVTTNAATSTARGTRFQLSTTPTGTTTLLARVHVDRSGNGAVGPGGDNTQDLGEAALRWKEIRCANNVINTSDAREKTPLRALDDTELAIARDIAGIVGIYQWLAAVAEKGEDGARLHCGAIAQEVIAAFEAHGRDAFRYGIACYDVWPETREPAQYETVEVEPAQTIDHPAIYERTQVYTAEGMPERFAERLVSPAWTEVVAPAVTEQRMVSDEVIHPAGNRYSLRYGELAMFLIAGQEARLRALEDKLV